MVRVPVKMGKQYSIMIVQKNPFVEGTALKKQYDYNSEYIKINGIEQYLLHYISEPALPVMLFLHGGPGMAESTFAYTFQKGLSELFTIVHWDQRGAGKTLTKNKKNSNYPTIDKLLEDLLEVVRYLKKKYAKEKIVILGHSWGSMLGTLFVQKHPQEVLYYIGAGQLVDVIENEKAGYKKLRQLIIAAGNQKDMARLVKIGDYPESNYEKPMIKKIQAIRILQGKYKIGMNFGPIIKALLKSPIFQLSDLSSLFKGMSNNKGLWNFMFSSSLYSESRTYAVPVFYILGADDFQAPYTIAERYFNTLEAPSKKLFIMKGAAHFMMLDQPNAFTQILSEICALSGEY
jgi:pimeloyl-ACP methyl ester carboxylesterase